MNRPMRCIGVWFSLVSPAAVSADLVQTPGEKFLHKNFGDLQEELAAHAVLGQTIVCGLQPPVLGVLAKASHYLVRCWAPVAALERVQPGDRVRVSRSYIGDTHALGLESRVVEPRGDLQITLDTMLSVQEKLPVGSRVTVELP